MAPNRSIPAVLILAAHACLAPASLCFARQQGEAEPAARTILEAGRRAPASVSALIVLDRACVARQTPAGSAVTSVLDSLVYRGAMDGAWAELAARLGRTREQVFDELLGRRVVLMWKRGVGGADGAWAMMTTVPLETERRLRERLEVSPRKIVAGHAVMAVENGRIELTSERGARWATLLVAPASNTALFDEIIPTLVSGPAAPLSADVRFASLSALGDGELLVFLDQGGPQGAWFGAIARTNGASIEAGIRSGAAALGGCDALVTPWSSAMFERLSHDALFATIERPVAPRGRESALGAWLTQLPSLALGQEHAPLVGDHFALVGLEGDAGPSIAAALEVRSASLAAQPIDRLIAGAIALAGAPAPDGLGAEAATVRTASLTGATALPPMVRAALAGREVRWSYPLAARPFPIPTTASASVDAMPADAGWCIAGVGERAYKRVAASFTGPRGLAPRAPSEGPLEGAPACDVAPWVSLGMIRPAATIASLARVGVTLPPEATPLESVDLVRWAIRLDADNTMTGQAHVRCAEAPRFAPPETEAAETASAPKASTRP